jgi:hypothetical protein
VIEHALNSTAESPESARERRCIVTGQVLPDAQLIRYVAGPDGLVVPDIAARLPGRGLWVTARRDVLERATAKGHFSRAAKAALRTPENLPDRVEMLLVARMSGDLGLARRSGQLLLGFDNVSRALAGPGVEALVEAEDGAADGRRKLLAQAKSAVAVIDCLTCAELSLALGRENVVHAALKSGRLLQRLLADAGRLRGFRPAGRSFTQQPAGAVGPIPAEDKGRE